MKNLLQHLGELDLIVLQALAQMHGLEALSGDQATAASELVAAMQKPEHVAAIWEGLDVYSQAAMRSLLAADNRMPVPAFERRYGQIRRFGPGRLSQERPWANPANVAERLWYQGLIARSFLDTKDGLVECVHVPRDLVDLLPIGASDPLILRPRPCPEPALARSAGQAVLDDLVTLLIHVHGHRVWLSDHGNWRAQDFSQLAAQWLVPPDDLEQPLAPGSRLALVFRCAHELDFFEINGRRLRLKGAQAWSWLQRRRAEQMRDIVQAWRNCVDWDDLCLTPGLQCEAGNWRHDNLQVREAALALLGHAQAGEWYDWQVFIELVHANHPDFLRSDGNYHTWYIRNNDGDYLKGFEHWHAVEARFLHYLWSGPLHWLGVIDWDENGECWRLSQPGASVLGRAADDDVGDPVRLIVTDDFRVLIPTGARPSDRFQAARFSEWEASWPGYRYRISQRMLRKAGRAGISPAQVLDFLDRASGGRIPANVSKALAAFKP
ncbi:MAG: hypothetical protein J5I90_11285 [Caldilineales bacterium]|nr:hypothetical protein [Caldilineales bacterium]